MKREIKFRAWHKGLKEMLPNIQNHIGNDGWAFGQLLNNIDTVEIMQFTGVKDKNGIELFEGDILKDAEFDEEGNDISGYYPVVYDHKTCQFCIDNSFKKNGSSLVNIIEYFGIDNIEVVGNIYQNPELLPSGSIYGCH